MTSKKSKKESKKNADAVVERPKPAPVEASPPASTPEPPPKVATDVAATTIANPAFAKLAETEASIDGFSTFTPDPTASRSTNFVNEKYFSLLLQTVDQRPDLQKATGIDTKAFRAKLELVDGLSSFPAACQRLGSDVANYLDATLLQLSGEARAATGWLAWRANKKKDGKAGKIVKQLNAFPMGRGVTIPRKKKRASPGSTTAAAPSATNGTSAKKGTKGTTAAAPTNGATEASPPAVEAAAPPVTNGQD